MSISTVRTVLFDVAPELETTDSTAISRIDRFIARAQRQCNASIAGDQYDEAVAYLTAHRLTMSSSTIPTAGFLAEVQVDNARTRFSDQTKAYGDFGETRYGREFERIMESLFVIPEVLSDS